MADPAGRELVQRLTDEVLRIPSNRRAARRFSDVVAEHGLAVSLSRSDRLLMAAGAKLAPYIPQVVMPLVRRRILGETKGVVLPSEDPQFAAHAEERRRDGIGLLVNPLGESILGDDEARRRVDQVLDKLRRPDVGAVSIKASALVANLDVLDFDRSIERISEPLREIYRAALLKEPRGFVNLDMEEYRDLHLTVVAFTSVLDEPEFHHLEAGIVLQAYLPDSHDVLEDLGAWAAVRRDQGGAGIKIRIVKGANLAMESVEAELHDWVAAPYPTKADVDASYKLMLESALRPEWKGAIRVGVASHNLFDVAWALVTRSRLPVEEQPRIELEMLEGMAPAQSRAVRRMAGSLLLYAPVVQHDQIDASIAYLSRRLDENTAPENFLRALFTITPGSAEFAAQADRFRSSVSRRHQISTTRRRFAATTHDEVFTNEPDSDPTDPAVRERLQMAVQTPSEHRPIAVIDSIAQIDSIVATAVSAQGQWAAAGIDSRRSILAAVAEVLRRERFDTVQVMADEAVKVAREGDPEVSEAIDFAKYYGTVGLDVVEQQERDGAALSPRGVVVVASPWNFPYAIPAGGVLAALAAGNSVILKPAPEARRTAQHLVEQLHRGGVPSDVVQFVACPDNDVGQRLISHPDVDSVVLTGAYETAELFRSWKPTMHLLAETSGKNAIVVTEAADLDLAIRDLVRSAFGHAGQKCSAASLAIVEATLYDSGSFMERLADATRSSRSWPAERSRQRRRPGDRRAVSETSTRSDATRCRRALVGRAPRPRWQPVVPGCARRCASGFVVPCHRVLRTGPRGDACRRPRPRDRTAECHALRAHRRNPFTRRRRGRPLAGRRSGRECLCQSWDHRRHRAAPAVRRMEAIVGWLRTEGRRSRLRRRDADDDAIGDRSRTRPNESYRDAWENWFSVSHDPTALTSESNELRYRHLDGVLIRIGSDTPAGALEAARRAAEICGTPIVVSDAATNRRRRC